MSIPRMQKSLQTYTISGPSRRQPSNPARNAANSAHSSGKSRTRQQFPAGPTAFLRDGLPDAFKAGFLRVDGRGEHAHHRFYASENRGNVETEHGAVEREPALHDGFDENRGVGDLPFPRGKRDLDGVEKGPQRVVVALVHAFVHAPDRRQHHFDENRGFFAGGGPGRNALGLGVVDEVAPHVLGQFGLVNA